MRISLLLFLLLLFSCKSEKKVDQNLTFLQQYHQSYLDEIAKLPQREALANPNESMQLIDFPEGEFYLDEAEVTNADFRAFVEETGWVTTAERKIPAELLLAQLPPDSPSPKPELLKAGALVFRFANVSVDEGEQMWWNFEEGACWHAPKGRNKFPGIERKQYKDRHPVVQVSWYDAMAYCHWADKRLPSIAEWEWAAASGNQEQSFPWGNDSITPDKANYWQGSFPQSNSLEDKYGTTARTKSFPAFNGLYDMAGNVWEWTADWMGGERETPADYGQWSKAVKGGSFLCNDSYCAGYRINSKMSSTPDTALEHTGFRCARTKKPN